MAGIAVGYGNPEKRVVNKMSEKMKHRGPDLAGVFANGRSVMAQNYLESDRAAADGSVSLPVSDSSGLRICYDGQIGNINELGVSCGISDGTFREERTILHLYRKHGPEMLSYLGDAIFGLVVSDGTDFFAARDLLGIKTLFYGRTSDTLYVATELKSILQATDEVYEFPAGHFMDASGRLQRFGELPADPLPSTNTDAERAARDIKSIVTKSLRNRIDFNYETASLLSGGIDSSVIAFVASQAYREKFGEAARIKTYALGVGESEDIHNARLVADHLQTDHHELIVDLNDILEVLPEVIYYLENFDPSLVRSSASNFLISRYAASQGTRILLSGEGGDEVFCGYLYLKQYPLEELHARQMACMGYLHNNASLRLDRMNQCNGVRVVAPLISGELLDYSLAMPPDFKQKPQGDDKI
ncbi:MAG: asparagine synthase-related protein, partial [Desulfomonilaceae bacterium]|nr:asparagine synthase-related protein [Desulfomonilaceae bacterium]